MKIKSHLPIIIFLILYLLIIAYKLIFYPTPFYDWDEAINVQVAKETVENMSLVPLWQGKAWLDKPPFPFLFFGIIMKLSPFIQHEISLRIVSLLLSLISLILIYAVYLKALNGTSEVEEESRNEVRDKLRDGKTSEVNKVLALLTIIIISFTPIFLQRSQIVNLDVFLLIGWLGYLLFVQNFWLSLFFLAIAVLTKSLIGFYPAIIILFLNLILLFKPKRLRSEAGKPLRLIKTVLIHISILSIWYLFMFIAFRRDFWQQHVIETHFRRVTASIESHFGQRTYYVNLMQEQLGILFWFSVVGLSLVILSTFDKLSANSAKNLSIYLRKSRIRERSLDFARDDKILHFLYLLPWFLFLNLTKTKIFWYLYPAIPQFAFLSVYPLILLRNKKVILYLVSCFLVIYIIYNNFFKSNFFTTFYSQPEDYYRLALYAKDRCDSLTVLVGKETREANKTLENLGLTITSSKQWGDHPSIIYYFGKKVDFYYDKNLLLTKLTQLSDKNCLAVRNDDLDLIQTDRQYNQLRKFNTYYLFEQ